MSNSSTSRAIARAACALALCIGALTGAPVPALAQAAGSSATAEAPGAARRPLPTRVYAAMWTMHLREPRRTIENNQLIGVTYRGWFAGTFLNSFGKRAYTAGVQRPIVVRGADTPLRAELGFRLGAISGYDGRFTRIAQKSPVLPIGSVYGSVEYRRVGIEFAYTLIVVSSALSYRF